jgi:hypothetical protein
MVGGQPVKLGLAGERVAFRVKPGRLLLRVIHHPLGMSALHKQNGWWMTLSAVSRPRGQQAPSLFQAPEAPPGTSS